MPSKAPLLLAREGPVATIVFNRPEQRNAINLAMWRQLPPLVDELERDASVRVVVVRGAGTDAFSAGGDISEFQETRSTRASGVAYNRAVREALDALDALARPFVAAIRGHCLGGGCEVALTADFRLCDKTARFGIPAARLGFSLDLGDVQRLVRQLGPAVTSELLLAGRTIDAQRAWEVGLATAVVSPSDLDGAVDALVGDLLRGSPLAQRAIKRDIRLVQDDPALTSVPDRDERAAELFESADYREGVRAFLEKRKPSFPGR